MVAVPKISIWDLSKKQLRKLKKEEKKNGNKKKEWWGY